MPIPNDHIWRCCSAEPCEITVGPPVGGHPECTAHWVWMVPIKGREEECLASMKTSGFVEQSYTMEEFINWCNGYTSGYGRDKSKFIFVVKPNEAKFQEKAEALFKMRKNNGSNYANTGREEIRSTSSENNIARVDILRNERDGQDQRSDGSLR